MNLKNFDKFELKDFKDIKISQVKEALKNNPAVFINISLIGITIFATIYTIQQGKNSAEKLKEEISQLKEKQTIVNAQKEIQKEHDDFLAKFPKALPVNQLIEKITDFAVRHSVQILSFLPNQESSYPGYKLSTFQIHVTSDNYRNIIFFIRDIEESSYALRLERWFGKININPSKTVPSETAFNLIDADIEIGYVQPTQN